MKVYCENILIRRMIRMIPILLLAFNTGAIGQRNPGVQKPKKLLPIIDMHIHADTMDDFGGGELSICSGDGRLVLPAIDPKFPFDLKSLADCDKMIK